MATNIPKHIMDLSVRAVSTTTGYPMVTECRKCNKRIVDQELMICPDCGSTNVDQYRIETYVD